MGREACAVFATEGAWVAAVDIDPALLAGTEAAVRGTDGEIASFVADVAVERQVREAVEGAVERFGALHVLHNNAGVLWRDRDVSVLETDEEIWDRVSRSTSRGWSGSASTGSRT
jgi:NAD(P)-dependent dehydrogenase (short-subunit alcohol dehydrogenase family)